MRGGGGRRLLEKWRILTRPRGEREGREAECVREKRLGPGVSAIGERRRFPSRGAFF